jgi:hypothetical protein
MRAGAGPLRFGPRTWTDCTDPDASLIEFEMNEIGIIEPGYSGVYVPADNKLW